MEAIEGIEKFLPMRAEENSDRQIKNLEICKKRLELISPLRQRIEDMVK
ncbi:MAG: hypothetical protein LBS87_02760 [Puniceicoccales bacterium]|nr:hypothetical protein [Puniceicoccales bacterium]